MKKSMLLASAFALTIGLIQSGSVAQARGHGGGHHGGSHHGGGGQHHGGGGNHGGGNHNGGGGHHSHNNDHHDDHHHHHDGGNFWAGAAVGGLVGYGVANSHDPCNDVNYRATYPGRCPEY